MPTDSAPWQGFRQLIESLDVVVWEMDAVTMAFRYVSPRAETLFGYPISEWLGDPSFWSDRLLHPQDRERAVRICGEATRSGEDHDFEYRAMTASGDVVWVRDVVRVLTDDAGEGKLLRGVLVDVTEERRLERQLLRSQTMDAIGRLAGGVAHDFNNILTAIRGHVQLMLEDMPENDPLRENAAEIDRAASHAASLTRQLLALGRQQAIQPRIIDPGRVLGEMMDLLGHVIGEDITLECAVADAVGPVLADPIQIEQIVLNLAVNARDAMPDGGALSLSLENVELGASDAGRHPDRPDPGWYVRLDVRDTGLGMSAETLTRVFEPFFTTKGTEEGRGLGLATVHGIVKQAGGFIEVESEPGAGTLFRVWLPRAEGQPEESGRGEASDASAGGAETVLLVEDEAAVRGFVRQLLERRGYTVLAASRPAEALELAETHADGFDLLITDVVMPEMAGSELADRIRALSDDVPVLFMSGYTEDEVVRRGLADGGSAFIAKPFQPDELLATLRAVLDGE